MTSPADPIESICSDADAEEAEPEAASDAVDARKELVSGRGYRATSDANSKKSGDALMPRRNDEGKEGHGKPKGVRLTARTDSEGENPKDGAGMEKDRQVTRVGVKRPNRSKHLRKARNTQRQKGAG